MNQFFNYEGKFNTVFTKVIDCVIINILWFLCSIPLVTIGASTTALYHTTNKVVFHGEGYVVREFFGAFKSNFKQSTIIWVLAVAMELMFFIDYRVIKYQYDTGMVGIKFYYFFIAMMVLILVWAIFAFAYTTKFNNTIKQIIRNSFIIGFKSISNTLNIIVILGVAALVMYVVPIMGLILPSFTVWCMAGFMNRIYEICLRTENK